MNWTTTTFHLNGTTATRGYVTGSVANLPHEAMDSRAREVRVRLDSALRSCGAQLPPGWRPEFSWDLPGPAADLACAVAALKSRGDVPSGDDGVAFIGELGLSGRVRPVRGVLPMVLAASELGLRRVVVPLENAAEAAAAPGVDVRFADDLSQVVVHLRGDVELPPALPTSQRCEDPMSIHDLEPDPVVAETVRLAQAGRAILLVGLPGGGATMLARRLATVLPKLTPSEVLETNAVFSAAGLLSSDRPSVVSRPFRAPHHTVSDAGLMGGGRPIRPGEVSLAHLGVLFLDEVTEFRRPAIEDLARAVAKGVVVVRGTAMPANPLVVMFAHRCACGRSGPTCQCNAKQLQRHRARLAELGRQFNATLVEFEQIRVARSPRTDES